MKMALFSHFSRIYKSQVYDPELIFFPSFFFLSPFSSLSLSLHPLSVSLSFCSLVFVSHWSIWVLWASCIYLYIIFTKKGLFFNYYVFKYFSALFSIFLFLDFHIRSLSTFLYITEALFINFKNHIRKVYLNFLWLFFPYVDYIRDLDYTIFNVEFFFS